MSERPNRIKAMLGRVGEPFEVDSDPRRGVFSVAPPDRAQSFLSPAEYASANYPIWEITVPFDDSTAVHDEIEWRSQTLSVLRAIDVGLADEVICRTLIAAEA